MTKNLLAGMRNPFRQTIVKDAWESLVDVPEIHAPAFEVCCRAFENVRISKHCDSVLLHGGAGSGKTHLLGRLQRHWTSSPVKAPGRSEDLGRCVFLYCRLQTNPHRLWQHLRKTFVEDLLHRFPDETTQLQRLVACRFAQGDVRKQRPPQKWLTWLRNPANRDHGGWKKILLPWLEREICLGFSLQRVLYHVITGRHILEAGAWLKGEDQLPEESYKLLGIRESEEGQSEDGAREVVLSLCRLASPLMPVAFCFDQIEALQTSRDDQESFFLFGQMGASLFNSSNNALLISCIQSSVLDPFKEAVREADYDRIARSVETLDPLDKTLAYKLIGSRLDSDPGFLRLRQERLHQLLWPFELPDLDPVFSSFGTQTARKIIAFAGALFEKRQAGEIAPLREDPSVFLHKEFYRRRDMSLDQEAVESDISLAHGLPLLAQVLGSQWSVDKQPDRDVDFLFRCEAKRIGVSLCNQQNMKSLGARLKRLGEWQFRNNTIRLVLIRDGRLPINRTAVVTRTHLHSLREKGAAMCRPDPETLAALQALRSLLSDAMSGDLHHGEDTIAPATVQEWLGLHLDSTLRTFFGQIVGVFDNPSEGESEEISGILEVLRKHKVISLDRLAAESGQTAAVVENLVKRHPGRFGWLEGPPAVLFDYRPPEILSSRERDER